MLTLSLTGLASVGLLGTLAMKYTDASLPYLDSFTTVFAVIATFMVVKKQIENWILLAIVDAVSIIMYLYKGLYFTTFLYFIYTIIAVKGYLSWEKRYYLQNKSST